MFQMPNQSIVRNVYSTLKCFSTFQMPVFLTDTYYTM